MRRVTLLAVLALALAAPAAVLAAPQGGPVKPETSPLPTHLRNVLPAIVGIHVEVPPDRPSAATLGAGAGAAASSSTPPATS